MTGPTLRPLSLGEVLDAAPFNQVLTVDPVARTADVQGMVTYERLVEATLRHGLMPLVVPQLKTITLGGAVSGLGRYTWLSRLPLSLPPAYLVVANAAWAVAFGLLAVGLWRLKHWARLGTLAALLIAVASTTCRDDPAGPGAGIPARLALAPEFAAGTSLAAFGITIDSVRALVVRRPDVTILDRTVPFPADSSEIGLNLTVSGRGASADDLKRLWPYLFATEAREWFVEYVIDGWWNADGRRPAREELHLLENLERLGRARTRKELQDAEPEKNHAETDAQQQNAIPGHPVCQPNVNEVKQLLKLIHHEACGNPGTILTLENSLRVKRPVDKACSPWT